jgi:leucyl/phenylalanyl-tRNA--protein transferase
MKNRAPEPLDPMLVINAYAQGIFPMADDFGRIQWYAPDPRAILEHENLHVSRSLRARLRKRVYEVRMDTDFEMVIGCCAERNRSLPHIRSCITRDWPIV